MDEKETVVAVIVLCCFMAFLPSLLMLGLLYFGVGFLFLSVIITVAVAVWYDWKEERRFLKSLEY